MSIFDEYIKRIGLDKPRSLEAMPRVPVMQHIVQVPSRVVHVVQQDPLIGLPVIVLGRNPPLVGHYLYHSPEMINGRWHWRIYVGYYEIWATVYTPDGKPVAHYPFIVNGLPSIGAFIAQQHAHDIRGFIRLYTVGITEPIDEVLVPEDSIMFMNEVMRGRFRMLLIDPTGILKHQNYDLVQALYTYQELVQTYAQSVHNLDLEVHRLRTALNIKNIEVSKYKSLIDELERNLLPLIGTIRRLQHELDKMRTELEYWQKIGMVRQEYISSLIDRVRQLEEELARNIEIANRLMSLMGDVLATHVMNYEQKLEQLMQTQQQATTRQAQVVQARTRFV